MEFLLLLWSVCFKFVKKHLIHARVRINFREFEWPVMSISVTGVSRDNVNVNLGVEKLQEIPEWSTISSVISRRSKLSLYRESSGFRCIAVIQLLRWLWSVLMVCSGDQVLHYRALFVDFFFVSKVSSGSRSVGSSFFPWKKAAFSYGSERSWWVIFNSSKILKDGPGHQSCCRDSLNWLLRVAMSAGLRSVGMKKNYSCSYWS